MFVQITHPSLKNAIVLLEIDLLIPCLHPFSYCSLDFLCIFLEQEHVAVVGMSLLYIHKP